MVTIPVLKLSMLDGNSDQRREFISQLKEAAHDVGFFYLSDHDISPFFLRKIRELTKSFFLLPEEEKLSIAMINSPHFRGYNRAGNERTNGKTDWRESSSI